MQYLVHGAGDRIDARNREDDRTPERTSEYPEP